jgi:hypothetical protein
VLEPITDERKLELVIVDHQNFCPTVSSERQDSAGDGPSVDSVTICSVCHKKSMENPLINAQAPPIAKTLRAAGLQQIHYAR